MNILSKDDKIILLGIAKDIVIQTSSKPTIESIEDFYRKLEALIVGEEKPTKKMK